MAKAKSTDVPKEVHDYLSEQGKKGGNRTRELIKKGQEAENQEKSA